MDAIVGVNIRTRKVFKKCEEAEEIIDILSDIEKCEVYDKLNSWRWDERLGEPPENWERLKRFRDYIPGISKMSYTWPLMLYIESTVGNKAILRHHHIHNLNRTEEEFEKWWKVNGFNMLMQSYRRLSK